MDMYDDGPVRMVTPADVAQMSRGGGLMHPGAFSLKHIAACALSSAVVAALSSYLLQFYLNKSRPALTVYFAKLFVVAAVVGALICAAGELVGL